MNSTMSKLEPGLEKTYTLAILNLESTGISISESIVISDILRNTISKTIKSSKYIDEKNSVPYLIIERTKIEKIFEHQDLGYSCQYNHYH